MTTTTTPIVFRGQYRQRALDWWVTFTERASEGDAWDELLTSGAIPRGADLRVLKIGPSPAAAAIAGGRGGGR